jgi:6-phosphogluconolactonase
MSNLNLVICPDPEALAMRAAELIVDSAREAIERRGRFTLVLSGGSTPEKTYRRLADPEMAAAVDWSKTCLFFGDERFVPPDDPVSNFGMARRSLLEHVNVPRQNIFAVPTDCQSADQAAREYGQTLARFFGLPAGSAPAPSFDLVLLGLGDDSHTASLFPGMQALVESDTWVTWSPPGTLPPPVDRVTLTFPILNQARGVMFLVGGEKKAGVLHEILEGQPLVTKAPAAGIRPASGTVTWLVDKPAARLLSPAFQSRFPAVR